FMGAVAGGAAGGATAGAIYAAAYGQNILEGAMYGAIGGAVGGAVGAAGIGNDILRITTQVAAAGVTSGVIAELSGGRFSQGAIPAMITTLVYGIADAIERSNAGKGVTNGRAENQAQSRYAEKVAYNPEKNAFERVKDYMTIGYKAANIIKGIIQMNRLYYDVVKAAFQIDCDVIVPSNVIVHQYSYNPPTFNYIRLDVGPSISRFEPSYIPVRVGIIGQRGCDYLKPYDDNLYWRQGTPF
ncbi:MAG: hypothetical protein AB1632_14810, partial [Nitrospirota bacterium]